MKIAAYLTRIHKWLGLIVGAQIILWTAGGVVMSVLPLAAVRSEHLVQKTQEQPFSESAILSPLDAAQKAGLGAPLSAQLKRWLGQPVYEIRTSAGPVLVDAVTARRLSPISADQARKSAIADYAGKGRVSDVRLIDKGPVEVRFEGPFWRVTFDQPKRYTIWVDPQNGSVRARRSGIWRLYDFFWMLHIMDYGARENFNTPWLIAFALSAFAFALTGAGLLVHRFALRPRRRRHTHKN